MAGCTPPQRRASRACALPGQSYRHVQHMAQPQVSSPVCCWYRQAPDSLQHAQAAPGPDHKWGSTVKAQQAYLRQLGGTQTLACCPCQQATACDLFCQATCQCQQQPTADTTAAAAGLADWQAFCQPRYSALASKSEVESMAAKIVELCREGLTAGDIEQLFQQSRASWTSDLQQVFLPNMAYLRGLLAGESIVPAPYEPPRLTPLGRLLRNQPAKMGELLNRSLGRILEVESWLCGELGLSRKQLALSVLKQPMTLLLTLGTSKSVLRFLTQELGVSLDQAANLVQKYATLYAMSSDSLARKCSELAQVLNVPTVGALVVKQPRILLFDISQLPSTLRAVDALLGRDGAGVELLLKAPIMAHLPPQKIERAVESLTNLGLDRESVRDLLSVYPDLLVKDLEGQVQQQKLQWAQEQLGWPIDKLLREGFFTRSLLRLASRLAFMRHLGLPDPGSLTYIGCVRESEFLAAVGKAAGRDVSAGEFAEWVAAWQQTPEGQRWGFKPQKLKKPAA